MKILKRIFNTDFNGNVISSRLEELNDNENGDVEELHLTSVSRCEACGRPLEKMNEIRGSCIICGRSCCSICEGFCAVCRRGPICGHCRTGFPEKGLSVCSNCLPTLQRRQAYQDRLLEEKVGFEQRIALCNAKLKFIQLLQHNKGRVSRALTRVAQIHIARKIARLERQLRQEDNRGRRLP
jgi:hypothetical protein